MVVNAEGALHVRERCDREMGGYRKQGMCRWKKMDILGVIITHLRGIPRGSEASNILNDKDALYTGINL